jgi:hypothetical protein
MRRRFVLPALVVGVLLAGTYLYASPYLTVSKVRRAALAGDADTVSAHVDFPALRDSFKSSMAAFLAKQMAKDETVRSDPYAVLGAGLAMMVADKIVDLMVTPEGVRAMVTGRRPQLLQPEEATRERAQGSQDEPTMRYEGLDRFTVTFPDRERSQDDLTMVWRRNGFTWKLTAVRLPLPE